MAERIWMKLSFKDLILFRVRVNMFEENYFQNGTDT